MRRTAITGVGGYLPDYVLTNKELESMVDTSDEWIRTRTGILERRIMKDGATSDMGAAAVRQLLEKLSIDKKSQIPGSKKKQLELFTQLPDQASFSSEPNKEIGICRARAFINHWNRSGESQVKEQALSGNEKMMEPLLQFSVKLFLQEFFAGEE